MRRRSTPNRRQTRRLPRDADRRGESRTGVSLSNQAYELIKRDITLCLLPPGAEVSETDLTKRYGFGKAPIRAALLKLSQDRLLTSSPRRGYTVAPVTLRDVEEIYQLRSILEPALVKKAVLGADIAPLRALLKRLNYSNAASNPLDFLEAHCELHTAVAKASGNERATRIVATLLSDAARVIHLGEFAPSRSNEALEEDHKVQQQQHEAIVAALGRNDGDLAERLMREHIEHSWMMFKKAAFSSTTLRITRESEAKAA